MDNLAILPVTMCFSKAALAAGTTTTFSTTGTTTYAIRSKFYTKTVAANVATPTTDVTDGLAFTPLAFPASASVGGQGSVFVFCYRDVAATTPVGFVAQGSVEQLDVSGNFINAPQFPVIPDGYCPIGYLVVKLGPTAVANWVFGTNNLSGVTGVTYTFVDVAQIPDRPQIL